MTYIFEDFFITLKDFLEIRTFLFLKKYIILPVLMCSTKNYFVVVAL
jgi:hypothetical protein